MLARSINGEQYLISPDFKYIYKGGGNLDFSEVNNVSGIEFRYKNNDKEWKMYPLGVVFGLGFDTATEVTLLATTALLASQSLPFYAILCLPILFTAGMTLLDTLDGIFMNFAYSWAFFNPVRKVYYNLAITGLSVAICFFIGGIEVLGLVGKHLSFLQGSFWDFMTNFDTNKAGFVIVGMFVLCWAMAAAYWKFGRVEEKWSAGQQAAAAQSVSERP